MAQEDELPPPEKKKSKLKWIIMLLLVLLLGGGLGGAYFMGFFDSMLNKEETEDGAGKTDSTPVKVAPRVSLQPFLVNISDPLARRYAQIDIELELISPEVSKEIEAQNARIRDALILLISSKTYSDLSTQDGKHILRNEILDRINQILYGPKVVRVYFTNFIIQ